MLDVVRHWLGRGVDGFRLDIFNAIYKDASFADNPFSFRPVPSEDNPHGFFQRNKHTTDHPSADLHPGGIGFGLATPRDSV